MCTIAEHKCIHIYVIMSGTWIKSFDSYGLVYDLFIDFLKWTKIIFICVLNMDTYLMGSEQEGELMMTFLTKLLTSVCDRHVKRTRFFKTVETLIKVKLFGVD